jgi:hypothetical protein
MAKMHRQTIRLIGSYLFRAVSKIISAVPKNLADGG